MVTTRKAPLALAMFGALFVAGIGFSSSPANAQSDINGEADLLVQLFMSLTLPGDFRNAKSTIIPLELWDSKLLESTHNHMEGLSEDKFDKMRGETKGQVSTAD